VIALTDEQLKIVQELARPLQRWQRDRFLQVVARRLEGETIGDGTVHAAAVAAQREVINGSSLGMSPSIGSTGGALGFSGRRST
jgi:hypothetical protein